MTAMRILSTLIDCEPAMNKLEATTNVLNELHRMKSLKGMPFFAIRRAIRIQERLIKNIN
jgi:hypothetical protein